MSDLRFSLDMIEVPIPCTVPWDSMRGTDRVRHCGQCRQNVYDLSSMSKLEVEAVVRRTEGKVCVRFFRRPDGTVVTRDCAAVRWSRAVWSTGTFVAFGILSVFTAACAPWISRQYEEWEKERGRDRVTAGKLCVDWKQPNGQAPAPEIAPRPREVQLPDVEPGK